jgi:hypothetical protein
VRSLDRGTLTTGWIGRPVRVPPFQMTAIWELRVHSRDNGVTRGEDLSPGGQGRSCRGSFAFTYSDLWAAPTHA